MGRFVGMSSFDTLHYEGLLMSVLPGKGVTWYPNLLNSKLGQELVHNQSITW